MRIKGKLESFVAIYVKWKKKNVWGDGNFQVGLKDRCEFGDSECVLQNKGKEKKKRSKLTQSKGLVESRDTHFFRLFLI